MGFEKNQIYTVTIEDIGAEGEGIGKIEGFSLFVKDALPGDARVLRDLRQGQVLVVVEVEELPLPVGQQLAVEVVEHGHAVGLVLHGSRLLFCKVS